MELFLQLNYFKIALKIVRNKLLIIDYKFWQGIQTNHIRFIFQKKTVWSLKS